MSYGVRAFHLLEDISVFTKTCTEFIILFDSDSKGLNSFRFSFDSLLLRLIMLHVFTLAFRLFELLNVTQYLKV